MSCLCPIAKVYTFPLLHSQLITTNTSVLETDDAQLIDIRTDETYRGMRFNVTAGVIDRTKIPAFERMLWRVSKGMNREKSRRRSRFHAVHAGNVFARFMAIEDARLLDPDSGSRVQRSVFLVFYQGEQLKVRVNKICEGFHAATFPCPEKASDRRDMMYGVQTRLQDLSTVLGQTEEHRTRLIVAAAKNLRTWYTKVIFEHRQLQHNYRA
jgi:V-type H+-transporting ATPase subunit a